MISLQKLWEIILESNTFNFIVLLVILAIVMQKLKITDSIEKMKDSIIQKIKNSEKTKEEAKDKYRLAKEKILHLDKDISEQIQIAKNQANNVAKSIEETTNKKIKQLHDNTEKIIKTEGKTIITTLNDKTAEASVEMAEEYITEKLQTEPELHDKYIEESITELEKVEL